MTQAHPATTRCLYRLKRSTSIPGHNAMALPYVPEE